MLVTAGLLGSCLIFPNIVNAMERSGGRIAKKASDAAQPLAQGGAFRLVIGKPYLLLIAALMIVSNLVNTNGEFILGKTVTQQAQRFADSPPAATAKEDMARASTKEEKGKKVRDFIARFYGDFFFTVNLISALAQLFLVSRVMKFSGVPASLFFLPIISLTGYSVISIIPALGFIRLAKIVENSTDYSLQNTARQALFLPTSREEKYKAKAAIDTFFVRTGDVLSTGLVFLSVQLSLSVQTLSLINVFLIVLWLLVVFRIGRSYGALTARERGVAA
jgi:ATP:ADP antiporter, AAA family